MGQIIPVTCDTVELFLNGKSFGQEGFQFPHPGMQIRYGNCSPRARLPRTTADLHLSWDILYILAPT